MQEATDHASGRFTYDHFAYLHQNIEGKMDVKKGTWTREEDAKLIDYITLHGEGRWNSLACLAGLKRTGRSCRLRWLNYLRPNLRRGNLTIQEQLLILELHFRYGNRWSRIAQHLPGRTDNEIKNYWRTRVQKQARLLNCDVNREHFRYTLRSLWLPRLMEQLWAASSGIHVQSSNSGDHSSNWTNTDMAAGQTGLGLSFASYEPYLPQCYPPACNDFWESHGSNKCSLENCPSERLCSPFFGGTGFMELDNQDFVHTEPGFGSQDIFLNCESIWHSVEQSLESLSS